MFIRPYTLGRELQHSEPAIPFESLTRLASCQSLNLQKHRSVGLDLTALEKNGAGSTSVAEESHSWLLPGHAYWDKSTPRLLSCFNGVNTTTSKIGITTPLCIAITL